MVTRRLEGLNAEQGEGGIELNPLVLRGRIISFVLQSAVSPRSDDTVFIIPLGVRAVRIIGDVDRVNKVVHCNKDLNFRSFDRVG